MRFVYGNPRQVLGEYNPVDSIARTSPTPLPVPARNDAPTPAAGRGPQRAEAAVMRAQRTANEPTWSHAYSASIRYRLATGCTLRGPHSTG